MKILDTKEFKLLRSEEINYNFDKNSGYMETWGKTLDDDPDFSPYGPFILDIELSTICKKFCRWCYKSLDKNGKNMNLETFIKLFNKLPKTLTQIAFGIGDIDSNPDLFNIMEYTRSKGVIPNITINGSRMTSEYYDKLTSLCGAVAVSYYDEESLNAVYELTKRGMKFVNIHMLLSKENLPKIVDLLNKYETDYRLANMNAIVFLSLKQKGRGVNQHPVNKNQFNILLNYLFENNIKFGFDACTSNKVLNYLQENNIGKDIEKYLDPCEASGYSAYSNVDGKIFPCSFVTEPYFEGIDLLNENVDFIKDIWNNEKIKDFRTKLLKCSRSCPIYQV